MTPCVIRYCAIKKKLCKKMKEKYTPIELGANKGLGAPRRREKMCVDFPFFFTYTESNIG